jgi:hypothetical protein
VFEIHLCIASGVHEKSRKALTTDNANVILTKGLLGHRDSHLKTVQRVIEDDSKSSLTLNLAEDLHLDRCVLDQNVKLYSVLAWDVSSRQGCFRTPG